ncbi:hypothetical protein L195_g021733 [Trifolium pratense]|uniref:Uncharacterized protein n=1 Tax=Trifolium pratense TaxID=57577 RepID=A0A2K3N5Z5_TRIPR|nr:hypothetical protein L195_g021733 [Trifolium pratense]
MVTEKCNVNGNIPTLIKRIHDLKNMNWQVLESPPRKLKSLIFYDSPGACMSRSVFVVS